MKPKSNLLYALVVSITAWCSLPGIDTAAAGEVDARLSSGQAYVGSPITLQIEIEDVSDYEAPEIPSVDGLTIESSGGARRSSQTVIINGRMSSTQSVVLQYFVTPEREGTFEIPPMTISIDGQNVKTSPLGFIASRSEVGDLMYVEIEGKQDRVYVGEPLELVLKVWVKIYQDDENDYTFSEQNTWDSFSEATSWGPFAEKMQELASQRKRPGGEPVTRKNDDGELNRYFLYEIEATIYPNKPGLIDGSDVRIVFDYPVELRRSRNRSPFDDFFGGRFSDPFGGRMPGGGMDSDFGTRLAIEKTRPIAVTASVDETRVIPIPMEDRPASFQGAVGRYELTSKIDLRKVNAGDPITLQIGVSGDGPLSSIQAPPLEALKDRFRLDGQPLAGFIRDGVKYFTTTIRPIDETVSEVPFIEMSYFDPETATFETVKTSPIPIQVKPAEKLAMDSIVGPNQSDGRPNAPSGENGTSTVIQSRSWSPISFLARNQLTSRALENQPRSRLFDWAIWFYGLPLSLFVLFGLIRSRSRLRQWSRALRSNRQRAVNQLADVQTPNEIPGILQQYVHRSFGRSGLTFLDHWQSALGQLRSQGHPQLAADLESLAYRVENSADDKRSLREEAMAWIERAESARNTHSVAWPWASGKSPHRRGSISGNHVTGLLVAGMLSWLTTSNAVASSNVVLLDRQQQEILLNEANIAYQTAVGLEGDSAADSFRIAAQKYQQLVDSGLQNGQLYASLANAYYQFGDMGRAIANYRLAMQVCPLDWRSQIMSVLAQGRANTPLSNWHAPLGWLVLGVLLWWAGLLILCIRLRHRTTFFAVTALALSIICLLTVYRQTSSQVERQAIAVVDRLTLHEGEAEGFDRLAELNEMVGAVLDVQERRGDWLFVRTSDGQQGWVPEKNLVELLPNTA